MYCPCPPEYSAMPKFSCQIGHAQLTCPVSPAFTACQKMYCSCPDLYAQMLMPNNDSAHCPTYLPRYPCLQWHAQNCTIHVQIFLPKWQFPMYFSMFMPCYPCLHGMLKNVLFKISSKFLCTNAMFTCKWPCPNVHAVKSMSRCLYPNFHALNK
jgi:hypothetical protein